MKHIKARILIASALAIALVAVATVLILNYTGIIGTTIQATTQLEDNMADKPTFTITLENGQELTGELYPDIAPESVGNFIALANEKFYDGLIFHRVIPGFMIQAAAPPAPAWAAPATASRANLPRTRWTTP